MTTQRERSTACSSGGMSISRGFTLIELMIVLVIVAIGIALAVPTFQSFRDKRQLTSAAEQISSFLVHAQGEAIKRNEQVTVSWFTPGGHATGWCVGAVLEDDPCDCLETDPTDPDFCEIDGAPYRLVQTDFTNINYELMHMNPETGSFSFDPVRGVAVRSSATTNTQWTEIFDGDYLYYVHSDEGSGSTREFELQIQLDITGRVRICTSTGRQRIVGGYPEC